MPTGTTWRLGASNEMEPHVSPDEKWIAYTSDETNQYLVYVRAFPSGADRVQISVDGGTQPMWSRHGRHLYFARDTTAISHRSWRAARAGRSRRRMFTRRRPDGILAAPSYRQVRSTMDDRATLAAALAGRYETDREIGRGGMATVYLARDLKHERSVALKVLHPDLAAALGAERFLAEIRTTANLQHPHILPLHDSGEADGYLFYVMPFVAGETLRARLERENVLPIDDALRIAREVLSALDYAHRHGVVHRDIKPENILVLDKELTVKLADFGLAKIIGEESFTSTLCGTPSCKPSPSFFGTPLTLPRRSP
jgi:tRNA A-37 threonylcarbamoyl transferase component Bud32